MDAQERPGGPAAEDETAETAASEFTADAADDPGAGDGNPLGQFDQLLNLLGIGADERISISHQRVQIGEVKMPFEGSVYLRSQAVAQAAQYSRSENVWFGVNPISSTVQYGRGGNDDVTRLVALYGDFDIKQSGAGTREMIDTLIGEVSTQLTRHPGALVDSGNGVHAYWLLDSTDPAWTLDTDEKRAAAKTIFARFHLLQAMVAEHHGVAVDKVCDLARVLRVPGSSNRKVSTDPRPVTLTPLPFGEVEVLSYAALAGVLDAAGVPQDGRATRSKPGAGPTEPGEPRSASGPHTGLRWHEAAQRIAGGDRYVYAAVLGELSKLAETRSGGRNNALNTAALKLARLSGINLDVLESVLIEACEANGLVEDDGIEAVYATITSAYRAADGAGPRNTPGDGSGQQTGGGGVSLVNLADVEPERVDWLWQDRIPRGKITVLDGDPGLGKSTLALSIAATVTTGGTWPDGTTCAHPGDVLLLSAEDGLADTVRPRLDAAGADVSRVHAIQGVPEIAKDGTHTLRPLTLAEITKLTDAVQQTDARLLIVDVLMAYLPSGTDSHKDQDVRRVMSALAGLADKSGMAVLALRHLNKDSRRDPIYRGGGSIGIIGAARSGLLVGADRSDRERRILAGVKTNLGRHPASLAYRLVDVPLLGVARVEWEGVTEHTAEDLLGQSRGDDGNNADAQTEAERWLTERLASKGPVPSAQVKEEAGEAGIRRRTVERAATKIGVLSTAAGFPKRTHWELPGDTPTEDDPPGTGDAGATGATAAEQGESDGATGSFTQSRHMHGDGVTAPTVERAAVTDEVPDGQADCTPGQTRSTGLQPDLSTPIAVPTPLEAMHARREQSPRRRRTRGAHRAGHPNG